MQLDLQSSLQQIKSSIHFHDYQQAIDICTKKQGENNNNSIFKCWSEEGNVGGKEELPFEGEFFWELESLKGYCLGQINKIGIGIDILSTCLEKYPYHTPSLRRLARLHQKSGDLQTAMKFYRKAQLYQPDNPFLIQKIYKLEHGTPKPTHKITKIVSADNLESQSSSKQHVTFGTSKIIQMTSDHSDQYFAHIQEQLSKLNETKPKKSILKTSTSYHKQNHDNQNDEEKYHHLSEYEEKEQLPPIMHLGKSLSIKSCGYPEKWVEEDNQQPQEKKTEGQKKKQKKKKKAVSFCWHDDTKSQKQ